MELEAKTEAMLQVTLCVALHMKVSLVGWQCSYSIARSLGGGRE